MSSTDTKVKVHGAGCTDTCKETPCGCATKGCECKGDCHCPHCKPCKCSKGSCSCGKKCTGPDSCKCEKDCSCK